MRVSTLIFRFENPGFEMIGEDFYRVSPHADA
jgi:hypothetical protein